MNTKQSEPKVGYVLLEMWDDDYSDWSGVITSQNPRGANKFANEAPMFEVIEKKSYDQLLLELEEAKKELERKIVKPDLINIMERQNREIEQLKADNAVLKEAVEFYADRGNMDSDNGYILEGNIYDDAHTAKKALAKTAKEK